ncbi:hypothetical protein Dimus_009502 [Dionaea muscipula]
MNSLAERTNPNSNKTTPLHFPKSSQSPSNHKSEAEQDVGSAMTDYKRGDIVEICSEEEGFKGSYYVATIVAQLDADAFTIEYATLLDENELDPLREVVRARNIRPAPPTVDAEEFHVGDEVEARDNDGWWIGRVMEKLGRGDYYVLFENSGEVAKYHRKGLRAHLEWIDGRWIRSPQRGML